MRWTKGERRMMRVASRHHLLRWGTAGASLLLLSAGWQWNQQRLVRESQLERMVAEVDGLRDVRGTELTRAVQELTLGGYPRELLRGRLLDEFERESDAGRRLPLSLALAAVGVDQTEYLTGQVLNPLLPDSGVLVSALAGQPGVALSAIERRLGLLPDRGEWRARARLSLVALQLGEPRWSEQMCRTDAGDPAGRVWWIREVSVWGGFGQGAV
ncbi:MAG: hypothetical protein ACKPJJ_17875, partial [Planctomycetaceae bacterium]